MGFRITTNMMMNTYRYNLMNNTNRLSDARDQVLTHRNFNSYAEDPAAASQAFRLRRQWYQTSNQLDNNDATYNKFHTAWTNLSGVIKDLSDANGRVSAIRGLNGTAGESRTALALVLRETADSVVQSMNQKVGEQFIFAGNDGLNVPFSWNDDHTVLYYRGVNVNAGGVEKPDTDPTAYAWTGNAIDGATYLPKNMPASSADEDEQAWIDYYRDQADVKKLEIMGKEEVNLDLGMGLKEVNGKLVNGAAFDSALRGISFLNSGVDEDGDPKNLALVMRELADVFEAWSENGQKYLPEQYRDMSADDLKNLMENNEDISKEIYEYDRECDAKANRLLDKLNAAQAHITEKYVELDAKSSFLKTNGSRLSTEVTNLNEQVLDVEQVDLAQAITQFSWDQYCYNAALKIGNQLLSQSLIDYMN